MTPLARRLAEIRACRICRDAPQYGEKLPHQARPVLRLGKGPPIIIAGQAPGRRVHESGLPFTDPSGDRLRDWLGIGREVFYDEAAFGIIPMGFCFPGNDQKGGDLKPRRECRETWHDGLFSLLPAPRLLILIGAPALDYHLSRLGLAAFRKPRLTDIVADWQKIAAARTSPRVVAMPHPSWRNNAFLTKYPWFGAELLPWLRCTVADAMAGIRQVGLDPAIST